MFFSMYCSLLCCLLVPETPLWLFEKNRADDTKSVSYVLQQLTSKAFLKPYMYIGVIEALFNVCGFEVILIYMVEFVERHWIMY